MERLTNKEKEIRNIKRQIEYLSHVYSPKLTKVKLLKKRLKKLEKQ